MENKKSPKEHGRIPKKIKPLGLLLLAILVAACSKPTQARIPPETITPIGSTANLSVTLTPEPSPTNIPTVTPFPTLESAEDSQQLLADQRAQIEKKIGSSGYKEASIALPAELLNAEGTLITTDTNNKLYGGTVTQITYDESAGIVYYLTAGHIVSDFLEKSKSDLIQKISFKQPHLEETSKIALSDIGGYVDSASMLGIFAVKVSKPPTSTSYNNFAYDVCHNPQDYAGLLRVFGFPYINGTYSPFYDQGFSDIGCFDYNNMTYLSTTTPTAKGLSGSPVTNEKGQIVGLVNSIIPNGSAVIPIPADQYLFGIMKLFAKDAIGVK